MNPVVQKTSSPYNTLIIRHFYCINNTINYIRTPYKYNESTFYCINANSMKERWPSNQGQKVSEAEFFAYIKKQEEIVAVYNQNTDLNIAAL